MYKQELPDLEKSINCYQKKKKSNNNEEIERKPRQCREKIKNATLKTLWMMECCNFTKEEDVTENNQST